MSTPRSSSTSSPPSDVPLDGTLGGPRYHGHFLNLQSAPLTGDHPIMKGTPLLFDANYPWNTDHVVGHCPGVLEYTWVNHIQTPSGVVPWDPCAMLSNGEFLSHLSSSTVVNENHGHHLSSVSYSTYEEGQNIAHRNCCAEPNSSTVPWPNSSDRHPLFPVITQEGGNQSFDQQNTWLSHAPSHAPLSYLPCYPYSDPSLPRYDPLCQLLRPTSHHINPGLTPARPLEAASGPHHETHVHRRLSYNRIPRQNPAGPSRHGRAAHVIEYDGLWIDERELIKGLTEANGKLTVHPCHWDHAPCHLWVTADKSSINAHIQTWHDGKPGGDKLQVHCSWSGCGKTMSKGSIARHIVTIHLEEVLECQGCGKEIPRSDVYERHAAKSVFNACRTLGALVSYSADARVIDARAALESGRKF